MMLVKQYIVIHHLRKMEYNIRILIIIIMILHYSMSSSAVLSSNIYQQSSYAYYHNHRHSHNHNYYYHHNHLPLYSFISKRRRLSTQQLLLSTSSTYNIGNDRSNSVQSNSNNNNNNNDNNNKYTADKNVKKSFTYNNNNNNKMNNNNNYVVNNRNQKSYAGWSDDDIQANILLLQQDKYNNDLENFTKNLKTFASGTDDKVDLSSVILPIISDWNNYQDQFTPDKISDWLWSLGKLGFKCFNIKHKNICMDLIHRFCLTTSLTSRQVTTSFGGFQKMGMKWSNLNEEDKHNFIDIISSTCTSLNSRELPNLLHSLCKVGVRWEDMSIDLQDGLIQSFMKHSSELKSQQGSMSIYSLGLLGLKIDDIMNPSIISTIYSVSASVLSDSQGNENNKFFSQQCSNVIFGLAKLGVQSISCPIDTKIQSTLLQMMTYMNDQEVANTVYSLGIMGTKWNQLSIETRRIIEECSISKLSRMIPQGLSNTVYGLGIMECSWIDMSDTFKFAIHDAINANFNAKVLLPYKNSQAVANVIYALGLLGAVWNEYPMSVRKSLTDGLILGGPYFNSQEVSNVYYGLGHMRANFHELSSETRNSLVTNFERISNMMNEQEVCSSLHGLAKMDGRWYDLPEVLRKSILICALKRMEIGNKCVACTAYSLGCLGAEWDDLPRTFSHHITKASLIKPLTDQQFSNTLYGLGLMQAKWVGFHSSLRDALLNNLAEENVFQENIPQHVSNSIWALSKMDAPWSEMPIDNIQRSVIRCSERFSHQELANTIYGIAQMEAIWSEISLDVALSLEISLRQLADEMTVQEMANVMYAFAIMAFDSIADSNGSEDSSRIIKSTTAATAATTAATTAAIEEETVETSTSKKKVIKKKKTTKNNSTSSSDEIDDNNSISTTTTTSTTISDEKELRLKNIWKIHEILIRLFKKTGPELFEKENFDQFAIYFELMRVVPKGSELVMDILGYHPRTSGPSATIPSKLHATTSNSMLTHLLNHSIDFDIFNEFNGLQGVFPIDTAVYYKNELVALVEIDGEYHYKSQQLRRKDRLKDFLYRHHYSNIPLYRMKYDQINVIGTSKAGQALANWIARDLFQ